MPTDTRHSASDRRPASRPVHEIRFGRIRAAIWENENEHGTVHRVSVSKSYRVGEQWKETTSFLRDDLPLVAKAVDQCHSWIFEQGAATRPSDDARQR